MRFSNGVTFNESDRTLFFNDKCDKYDYLIAVISGVVAGLVDIFLVGSPLDSKLQPWTDHQVDNVVMSFAKMVGWSPREGKEGNVRSAIGFLEKKFRVNYDQRHMQEVNGLFDMATKNHHMKSLAHSPDIVGLFFSIVNQFTSTASFMDEGRIITIHTKPFELQGTNFASKIFAGFVNWFGHIMSDVAGSSGSLTRGSGIVIPFYELLQLCNFGSFQVGQYRNTLATLATKAFQEGYDARFGITMSIPVIINELLIRFLWSVKRHFFHKVPLNECIPSEKHDDLRIMLIIGHGTLCLMDGLDAAIRSAGDWLNFFLRFNIIAWFRFLSLVLKEVFIRLKISLPLQRQLEAYIRINQALDDYLKMLESYDIERYRRETEQYKKTLELLERAETEEQLNMVLKGEYERLGISQPYNGNFDDFMKDPKSRLEFK
ncbi:MAG: hypothetical protein WHS64_03125 [Fervidobacterium sp.]|uniref:hypothetical protein n=1 Tax=Fervidobacterium TaxID=2422 RepID=UPI003097A2EC